jgi:hypothetical protein
MQYSISDLEKHFDVKKEEAALLFIFLTLLPPGAVLPVPNGQIEKLTEDTFSLHIDSSTYQRIAEKYLATEVDDYTQMFGPGQGHSTP